MRGWRRKMFLRRLDIRADRVDAVSVRLRGRLGCKMRLTVKLEDLTQMFYTMTQAATS
jgi:hypothetical protein